MEKLLRGAMSALGILLLLHPLPCVHTYLSILHFRLLQHEEDLLVYHQVLLML